jgi:ribosomal protein L40E
MQAFENEEAHVGDPQEIKHLIEKGAGRFSTLFYIGVVIGIVMGPGLLIAAALPAVRSALDATNYRAMLFLGIGMTMLLGVATVEQVVKVQKNSALLATLGAQPHRIAQIRKQDLDDEVTRLYFDSGDETWAHAELEADDARRLIWLLSNAAFVFCPYCVTLIAEGMTICSRCDQDTTLDAPLEMTFAEYRAEAKKACRDCGATLLAYAVRCPACGEKQ